MLLNFFCTLSICVVLYKATVIQLARKRVDEMVKGLSPDGMPIGDDGMPLLPLSGLYRRACLLLHVNVICFSHTAMKHLVQLGYTVSRRMKTLVLI